MHIEGTGDSTWEDSDISIVAKFEQYSNLLLMSKDASCKTGISDVEPCLQKGDLIFITGASWGNAIKTNFGDTGFIAAYVVGYSDTTDLCTITKIRKAEETVTTSSRENKFRITVDKAINWTGPLGDPGGNTVMGTVCSRLASRA